MPDDLTEPADLPDLLDRATSGIRTDVDPAMIRGRVDRRRRVRASVLAALIVLLAALPVTRLVVDDTPRVMLEQPGATFVPTASETPADSAVPADSTAPPDDVAPSDDPAELVALPSESPPPAGLVAVDYYDVAQPPPPPIAALLGVPACPSADGLAVWVGEVLGPFGGPSAHPFETTPLSDVIDIAPVLRDTAATCAVAGRQGDAHAWELRDAEGAVIGRGVASEGLAGAFPRVYERQQALGGVNFGQSPLASRQHVAGVLRGDTLELELTAQRPRRTSLYVVQIPGHGGDGDVVDGVEGQQVADALVGRLSSTRLAEPSSTWPLALPRALPPGYVRCAGPYLTQGFQTGATELCTAEGDRIVVRTENRGGNPVPDPPVHTEVNEVGDRIHLSIRTPVENVLIDAPASLGRELVEAMATTVPIVDRRVWFPAQGRGHDLREGFGPDWLRATLTAAGATDVEVTEGAWGCVGMGDADCSPPDPLPYEVRMRDAAGRAIEAYASALGPPVDERGVPLGTESTSPAGSATRVYTVGTTDLLVEDDTRTAVAGCGGVTLHLRPAGFGTAETPDHDRADPSIALLAAVLRHLAC